MKEEWRKCKGFEPFYEVSNTGKVRSVAIWSDKYQRILIRKLPKIKAQETTRDGYHRVLLSYYGKHYRCAVHRLVAMAFIENPNEYPCVNHKDENTHNNSVDNLEWCTWEYNSNYGTLPLRISNRMLACHPNVRAVFQYGLDGSFITAYSSAQEAARVLNTVSRDMISRACKGKAKTAGGYKWSYAKKEF